MAQDAVPDRGSVASGDFQFNNVPVFVAFWDRVQTFDMHFFIVSYLASPVTRNLQMNCDPFRIAFDPISLTCDYSNWIQIEGDSGMWMAGADGNPAFIPGDWNGLIISETPEPSTLALLFATLFLLAVGVRPSHR